MVLAFLFVLRCLAPRQERKRGLLPLKVLFKCVNVGVTHLVSSQRRVRAAALIVLQTSPVSELAGSSAVVRSRLLPVPLRPRLPTKACF